MQCRKIGEVLLHRQIKVQRGLLKHNAQMPKGGAGMVGKVVTGDLDPSALGREQAGQEIEQRRLPAPLAPSSAQKRP